MICLRNKKIFVSLYYTFRFSSWSRNSRKFYNFSYFSFIEAYRGFKGTEWSPYDKGMIIPGIKLHIDIL